jgi:hypothetical protein
MIACGGQKLYDVTLHDGAKVQLWGYSEADVLSVARVYDMQVSKVTLYVAVP